MSTVKPQPQLFLSDARGIYIPRDFSECVYRDKVTGITDENYRDLVNGPDDTDDFVQAYWEAWQEVLDNARITDADGTVYTLYQDGDLWLVPEGMEWDDRTNWYIWPEETED